MLSLVHAFRIYKLTIKKNFLSLRTIIVLILESIICLVVILPIVQAATYIDVDVNILEVVIAMNSSPLYFMLLMAGSLLLIADIPFFDTNESMILYRTNRKTWLFGKFLYIFTIILINIFFIFIVIRISMLKVGYIGNYYSSYFESSAYLTAPVTQFLGMPPNVMEEATPYYASASILILSILYMIFQALILFIVNLKFKRKEGILITLAFCILGYVLLGFSPKIAAFSPYNNTLLNYHTLNYQTAMPTIAQSYVYFAIVISILLFVLFYLIQKYSFKVRE